MNNSFGIYDKSFDLLCNSLKKFTEIEKAWIFGSRALGNYKKGSDIDLAIFGKKVNFQTVVKLSGFLNEEVCQPYFVDVVDFNKIKTKALREHIEQNGVIFYQ